MSKIIKKESRMPLVKESAQTIWLAGLGALAMTEEKGTELFKKLVKKGEKFETRNRERVDRLFVDVSDRIGDTVDEVRARTLGTLQSGIETATTGVLHRLNVPTRKEIASLTKRVETLTHSIEKKPARRRAPARKRAASKPQAALNA